MTNRLTAVATPRASAALRVNARPDGDAAKRIGAPTLTTALVVTSAAELWMDFPQHAFGPLFAGQCLERLHHAAA